MTIIEIAVMDAYALCRPGDVSEEAAALAKKYLKKFKEISDDDLRRYLRDAGLDDEKIESLDREGLIKYTLFVGATEAVETGFIWID